MWAATAEVPQAASGEEADEARALHVVATLVGAHPDAVHQDLRSALVNVLDVTAVELNNGRSVTRPVRIAIRRAVTWSAVVGERGGDRGLRSVEWA
jgi:hypothetical protein